MDGLSHKVPSGGRTVKDRPFGAGTTGGMDEEKLEKTDYVPGRGGHGNFAVSAC
jgi:hypothetical protein